MLDIVDAVSKVSPTLGAAIAGPAGTVVLALIKSKLGINSAQDVIAKIADPANAEAIKEMEDQIAEDVKDAREEANKEVGMIKFARPFLALVAMAAAVGDIYMINFVKDGMLKEILIVMLIVMIWDIRQIYKFYFGSSANLFSLLNVFKK